MSTENGEGWGVNVDDRKAIQILGGLFAASVVGNEIGAVVALAVGFEALAEEPVQRVVEDVRRRLGKRENRQA